MNCKKCGSQISVDSKYCNMCGAKVENSLDEENRKVELIVNPETTNVVNSMPPIEEIKQGQYSKSIGEQSNEPTSLESKENVLPLEQAIDNEGSISLPNEKNLISTNEASSPIVENHDSVVSQNIVNNDESNIQNSIANSQMMVQDNQSIINKQIINSRPLDNQLPNNINNLVQSKKKVPVGLIIGIVAIVFIIGLIVIFILTGGIKFKEPISSGGTTKQIVENKSTTTSTTSKINNFANSTYVFEAILKLYTGDEPTNKDYNQVVSLIGDGVKDENALVPTYIWKQDENTKLSIIFNSSGDNYIQEVKIDFNHDDLKEAGISFSGAQAISDNINKQIPVYYDDIKTSFGNEGHLYAFSSEYYRYVWVNEYGGYVEARFSTKTNQCLYFTGRI